MYWITEFVKFVCDDTVYEASFPQDYSSFLELLTSLFIKFSPNDHTLHYLNIQDKASYVSNEQDFIQIQDTGLRTVTIFITIVPSQSLPNRKDLSVNEKPHIRAGFRSNSLIDETKNAESLRQTGSSGVISSVYRVKDSEDEENDSQRDIFGEKGQRREPLLSGVYSWFEKKDDDNANEGMSRALIDGPSASFTKVKEYWDDFSGKVNEKIKENNVRRGIGGGFFGPFEEERNENKEGNRSEDKVDGENSIQEKDQEKGIKHTEKIIKEAFFETSTALKKNFKNLFKAEN
jgi:hypothetical protein